MATLISNKHSNKCFTFIGADKAPKTTHLISNNKSLLASNDEGIDTCSFYSGPSEASIMAFGESTESCGSIANAGTTESFSGSAVSCFTAVSSGSYSGGGCSYSCLS